MPVVLNLIATEVATKTTGGKSLGAMSVFTDDLRDKATGVLVGTHNAYCFRVRQPASASAPDLWVCHGGWDLQNAGPVSGGKKGNLVAAGLADFKAVNFAIPIAGGTDDFSKARGQITGSTANYPPLTDYTLEIETQ
jgi:hypothetical protein